MSQNAPDFSARGTLRIALGITLAGAGIAHLTFARKAFLAQVPETLPRHLPVGADEIVIGSGVVEIGLGTALATLPRQRRALGAITAAYFVAIFPGNVSQMLRHKDAFGLDTDRKRLARLFFQPLLVLWALAAGEHL